jgi:hypothetical protein
LAIGKSGIPEDGDALHFPVNGRAVPKLPKYWASSYLRPYSPAPTS